MQTIFFYDFNSLDRIRISPNLPVSRILYFDRVRNRPGIFLSKKADKQKQQQQQQKAEILRCHLSKFVSRRFELLRRRHGKFSHQPCPNPEPLEDAYDTQQLIINESAAKKKTVFLFCVCTNIQNRRRNQPL